MSQEIYKQLNPQRNEIRVFNMSPGRRQADFSQGIHLNTEIISLNHREDFACLSYVWGNVQDRITVRANHGYLSITKNLEIALRYLASFDKTLLPGLWCRFPVPKRKPLWVDAICIDQSNDYEMHHQISKMRDIYASASQVILWLGESCQDMELAFSWLQQLSRGPSRHEYQRYSNQRKWRYYNEGGWLAVTKLLNNRCFRRRWIFQEMVLPTNLFLVCGRNIMPWKTFSDGIFRCGEMFDASRALFRTMQMEPVFFRDITRVERLRLRHARGDLPSLFAVLVRATGKETTIMHDRIYALLGLCSNAEAKLQDVSYQKPLEDVFMQQVLSHIQLHNNLDFLNVRSRQYRSPQEGPMPDCPTWVPAWNENAIDWLLGPTMSLAKSPLSPVYSASKAYGPELLNKYDAIRTSKILSVSGIEIDIIRNLDKHSPMHFDKTQDPSSPEFESYLSFCFENIASRSRCKVDLLDSLFKVLTRGGRIGNSFMPLEILRQQCMQFFTGTPVEDKLARYREYLKPPVNTSAHTSPKVKADFSYISDLKLFISGKGRIGLCPPHSQLGDVIAIIFGCSSPLILARTHYGHGHYHILGEAYVDGLMFGKCIEKLEQGTLQRQSFLLH